MVPAPILGITVAALIAAYFLIQDRIERKRSEKIRQIAEEHKLDFKQSATVIGLEQTPSFELLDHRPAVINRKYCNVITVPESDGSYSLLFDFAYAGEAAGRRAGKIENTVYAFHSTGMRFKRCSLIFPYRKPKAGEDIRTIPLRWRYPGYNLQAVIFPDHDEELLRKLISILESQPILLCIEAVENEFIVYSPMKRVAPEELMEILKLGPIFKSILVQPK